MTNKQTLFDMCISCLNHHHQHRHYHKRSLSAVCLQKRAPNFFQQDHAQTRWRRVGQKLGVM